MQQKNTKMPTDTETLAGVSGGTGIGRKNY